ncbi:MAG: CheR family methyltransferase [Phycisphaerales bacterium JB060]
MTKSQATPDTSIPMTALDYEALSEIVLDRSGIELPAERRGEIAAELGGYLAEMGLDTFEQYLTLLRTGPLRHEEFRNLLERISPIRPAFFDQAGQLEAFECSLLPELIETRKPTRHLRIFSAACGQGQEAYTIAMIIHRALGVRLMDWTVEVFGCDLNQRNIEIASRGVYTRQNVRSMPEIMRLRYFYERAGQWAVNDEITQMVGFETLDLRDRGGIGRHGHWDAIICRDTLPHFDGQTRRSVLDCFHEHLAEDGVLLLGESEVLPPEAAPFVAMPQRSLSGYRRV